MFIGEGLQGNGKMDSLLLQIHEIQLPFLFKKGYGRRNVNDECRACTLLERFITFVNIK